MSQAATTVCDSCGNIMKDFRILDIHLDWLINGSTEVYTGYRPIHANACSLECLVKIAQEFWQEQFR